MTGLDLLNALNEIDDRMILEADSGSMAADRKKTGGSRIIRISGAVIAAAAVITAVLVSSSAIRNSRLGKTEAVTEAVYEETAPEIREDENGRIHLGTALPDQEAMTEKAEEEMAAEEDAGAFAAAVNPFTEYVSMDEAADDDMLVLEAPSEYAGCENRIVRCMGDQFTELVYTDGEGTVLFRIRKGCGSEDVSGDYNTYAYESEIDDGDCGIRICGEDKDRIVLATWTKNDYSYSVNAGSRTFTGTEISELVKTIA